MSMEGLIKSDRVMCSLQRELQETFTHPCASKMSGGRSANRAKGSNCLHGRRSGNVGISKHMMKRTLWQQLCLLTIFMLWVVGSSRTLLAQETAQPPASETTPAQTKTANAGGTVDSPSGTGAKPPQDDRIFWALPNYLTVENQSNLPPMSTAQKFKTVAQGCFDPVESAFIAIQAGIDQADNVNPTYGQGFVGYSKRYGTAYADAIIGNFGTGAIFPTLLHQDPRYYQMGRGRFIHRFAYAAGRILITRGETSHKVQFNFSEILGNGMAAGLANVYHPGPHTVMGSADVLGTQCLMDALGYELKEFWPDIHRFLKRAKH